MNIDCGENALLVSNTSVKDCAINFTASVSLVGNCSWLDVEVAALKNNDPTWG